MILKARAAALFLFIVLILSQPAESKKGDDSSWNLPSNNKNNNIDKNNKKDKKRSKNSKKKSNKNDSSFQTSVTFIPQQDLADPKIMKLINSPWNDKGKKEKLMARLDTFVRENLVDQDKVEKLAQRTRKEWEDLDAKAATQLLQGLTKIMAGMLSSPGFHKLCQDRGVQEKIRLYLVGMSILIRSFLDDPRKYQLLTDSNRWHALFDKMKSWEGAPHEQVLDEFLDFVERQTNRD